MKILFTFWQGSFVPSDALFCSDLANPWSYYSLPFQCLKDCLARYGLYLYPYEYYKDSKADALISVDLPSRRFLLEEMCHRSLKPNAPRLLIVMESPISRPELISRTEFNKWSQVFHYSKTISNSLGLTSYDLPSNMSHLIEQGKNIEYTQSDSRLIGMMNTNMPSKASNLMSSPIGKAARGYSLDLKSSVRWLNIGDGYHIRRKYARELSELYPDDFEVYGGQWDGSSYAPHHRLWPPKPNPCAMGKYVFRVSSLISKFKYFFAVENAIFDDKYITEKLFNVIRSGVVPLYLPPMDSQTFPLSQARDSFPFVDLRGIKSGEHLLSLLHNIDDKSYEKFLDNGRRFLASSIAQQHIPERAMSRLASSIVACLAT